MAALGTAAEMEASGEEVEKYLLIKSILNMSYTTKSQNTNINKRTINKKKNKIRHKQIIKKIK